jgi:hypothetical protein
VLLISEDLIISIISLKSSQKIKSNRILYDIFRIAVNVEFGKLSGRDHEKLN